MFRIYQTEILNKYKIWIHMQTVVHLKSRLDSWKCDNQKKIFFKSYPKS